MRERARGNNDSGHRIFRNNNREEAEFDVCVKERGRGKEKGMESYTITAFVRKRTQRQIRSKQSNEED